MATKLYQIAVRGPRACFENSGTFYSRKVYSTLEAAELATADFIAARTAPVDKWDMSYLREIKDKLIFELEVVE